jgi:bacillithiol synthase
MGRLGSGNASGIGKIYHVRDKIDTVEMALTEYQTVPADPSTVATPGAAARLAVDVRRLPWIRPLVGAYAFDFGRIAALYAGDPRTPEAWRHMLARLHPHPTRRREVAARLTAQQASREAPAEARANTARLAEDAAAAIVTGQQAGLFGGPLFTLLKAVNAVQLARRAEAALGVPVVPIFWVDAEDHDWDEVASATVLDQDLEPRTITLPAVPGAGERPIASLHLSDAVADAIAALRDALPATDFTSWIVDVTSAAYTPRRGVAEAFARWIESLLGPHGLVVCDAADPALKPLAAEVLRREAEAPGRTAALAQSAGDALASLGHVPQVTPLSGSLSLLSLEGGRTPIRRDGDQFVIGDRTVTPEALAREVADHPERFSPNVLLRPIVQDALFPTLCYVAGPSELAYLGQLGEIYAHFGVPMPLVHPRTMVTIVDSATMRFLTKYNLPLEDLQPQDEAALNRLLAAGMPASVDAAFERADAAIRSAMQAVSEAVPHVDPTLAGAARTTRGRLAHEVRTLRGKVLQAAKRRDETLGRQFRRAQRLTFPLGQPQERAVAGLSFLNLYGPALVDRLLEDLPLELGQQWVITI